MFRFFVVVCLIVTLSCSALAYLAKTTVPKARAVQSIAKRHKDAGLDY